MKQIIKQPNGKYCIFNSVVDNITHFDMSVDEIIEEWINDSKIDITKRVKGIVSRIGNNPDQFNDMLSLIRKVHGEAEYKKVVKLTLK